MRFDKWWWVKKIAQYKNGYGDNEDPSEYLKREYPNALYTPWDPVPIGQIVRMNGNVKAQVVGRFEGVGTFSLLSKVEGIKIDFLKSVAQRLVGWFGYLHDGGCWEGWWLAKDGDREFIIWPPLLKPVYLRRDDESLPLVIDQHTNDLAYNGI